MFLLKRRMSALGRTLRNAVRQFPYPVALLRVAFASKSFDIVDRAEAVIEFCQPFLERSIGRVPIQ